MHNNMDAKALTLGTRDCSPFGEAVQVVFHACNGVVPVVMVLVCMYSFLYVVIRISDNLYMWYVYDCRYALVKIYVYEYAYVHICVFAFMCVYCQQPLISAHRRNKLQILIVKLHFSTLYSDNLWLPYAVVCCRVSQQRRLPGNGHILPCVRVREVHGLVWT